MANKKNAVSRAAIDELIRKHKGKNAVKSGEHRRRQEPGS